MTTPAIGSRWRHIGTGWISTVEAVCERDNRALVRPDGLSSLCDVRLVNGYPCGYEPVEDCAEEVERNG